MKDRDNNKDIKEEIEKKELAEGFKEVKEKSNVINLEALLKKKEEEYNQLWDKYLRTIADFENTKKRLEQQKQEAIRFANEELIKELLNILDDLERTVFVGQSNKQNFEIFLKGVEMILTHLYELLKRYGVKPIQAQGKIFDPYYHEAVFFVENNDLEDNTIVEELQKGYILNDKVIRTSKVKISKKSSTF